jgi:hypothetical protein
MTDAGGYSVVGALFPEARLGWLNLCALCVAEEADFLIAVDVIEA